MNNEEFQQKNTFPLSVERKDIDSALRGFKDTEKTESALRYYEGAVKASSPMEQLTAVSLLKQTLDAFPAQNSSAALQTVRGKLEDYHRRLTRTVGLISTPTPVPKKLHFAWVGGGIGAIQGNYIGVWKQVLAPNRYSLNLWYDGDALLAHETNRIIVETAKASGFMAAPAGIGDTESTLGNRYVERARALREQMFDQVQATLKAGGSADQARIDLLVRAYGQDEHALKALKARNLQSLEQLQSEGVVLREIRSQLADQPLFDIYEREISFRANLAAASDITRLQAVNIEGGTYLDADLLPSLHSTLGGVDLVGFGAEKRMGVLQILLDHNPQIIPARGQQYADLRAQVPEQYREALVAFAETVSSLSDIFAPFGDVSVSNDGLRVGNKNHPEWGGKWHVRPFDGLSNAMFSAHPGSVQLKAVMEKIRHNYVFLDRVTALARQENIRIEDRQLFPDLIIRELEKQYGPISEWRENLQSLDRFSQAIKDYHADGLRFGAQSAIVMTGPTAVTSGLSEFVKEHALPELAQILSDQVNLFDGFNLATEEETHHSWKDNAKTGPDWFELEARKGREGAYKLHYTGSMSELLKGQTLTFEKGWPVIEGRAVLLTGTLQNLADSLGAPFIRAMNERLSGDLTFDNPWSLSFVERQQILAQGAIDLPVSIGFEPIGNLNEMLSRIAHGTLPLDQLSPVHRMLLGGLFGAQTLDLAGFEGAWQHTRDLAQNTADRGLAQRYIAIEHALLAQKDPRFVAGFAAGEAVFTPSTQNAQALKALTLSEPLTLRQWGEQVARVRLQSDHELRINIFSRSAAVLETFIAAGASTAKLMPQGLLIRGDGDPGRHCFPLVQVMAAALDKGPSAVDALSGRLANANLAPKAAETHVLMRVLDELRGVPMAESGTLLGATRLDQVLHILEGKTTTSTLMINTDSHSMLLAKVVNGESSSYRFYDPNFGVFGFEQAQGLRRGLEQFFSDPQLTRLYDIAASVDATFNVIELNGPRIADKALPSKISVAGVLGHEPVSVGFNVSTWDHYAALRLRSLSENARLGRGLAEIDGRHWAKQIDSSTTRLQTENKLGREFVPVFETLREVAGGHVEISLVNAKDTTRSVRVSSNDGTLSRIKSFLTETFQTLSVKPSVPGVVDPTKFTAVHSINAAFTVQALLTALKNVEQTDDINHNRSLTTAVRMHGYLTYAQLAHGNLVDVVELVKLFNVAIKDAPLVARTASPVLVNFLGHIARDGVATVLQLATVGFDIYLLVNAENDLQQAQYGTQLAFDGAGLALALAGIGAGFAGASTVAAFLGGAGVILGGLAVGVGALVEGFNGTLERARRIGMYLNEVERAYSTGGYSVKEGVFYPDPYAAIHEIDLRKKRMTFDSQRILEGDNYSTLHVPNANPDRSKAINIRQHLGFPEHATIADLSTFQTIVLPCVANTYFSFDYSALPLSTTRSEHFETALKLEYDAEGSRRFWFSFYKFPSEYILHNLYPVETETTITVLLDEGSRSLLVPQLGKDLSGKLSYSIEGSGGHCALTLSPGIRSVSLDNAIKAKPMAWTLRAGWLGEDLINVRPGRLTIDGIEIEVPGSPDVVIHTSGKSLRVDWATQQLLLEELVLEPDADSETIQTQVRALAAAKRLASPFTAVQNFLVPFGDPQEPQRTTAYFEQDHDRFIYSRDVPPALAPHARLGAVSGQHAYFFAPQEAIIWRIDAVTGQINRFYRLMDPVPGSSIAVFQDLGEGTFRVVQQVTQRTGREVEVTYLLGGDSLLLMSIAGHFTDRQQDLMLKESLGAWSNFFWDYELLVKDSKLEPLSQVPVVDYQPADFTAITRVTAGKKDSLSTWIRASDGLLIRPSGLPTDGPGGAVSALLLPPANTVGETVVFYDKPNRTLYRQKIGLGVSGESARAEAIELRNVVEVIASEGRYVALTHDGRYFDVNDQGDVQLAGLTEDWLENARGPLGVDFKWWKEVESTALEHKASNFTVLGLAAHARDRNLFAWYIEGRLLIADMGVGKVVRLLSVTPDKQAAWLLDVSAGQVYRQEFIAPANLDSAFGNTLQLLRPELLPAPRREWAQWSFVLVRPHDAGLVGSTADGLVIEMLTGEPARIVGVPRQWFEKQQSTGPYTEQARLALKALTSQHPHAPFILVSGYAGYHWYVSRIERVVGESSTELDTRILGVVNATTALLHEVPTAVTYSAPRAVWLENSVARREGEVLSLQWQGELKDLLPLIPDDVSQLVLSPVTGASHCHVSNAVWQRLECIVFSASDDTPQSGTLTLEVGAQDEWRVVQVEGHLLLTDPDSGHCLILRDAPADDKVTRGDVTLNVQVFGVTQAVSLEGLRKALDSASTDDRLAKVVSKMNEL